MGKDPEDQQCVYAEVLLELNSLVQTQTLIQVPLIGFFPNLLVYNCGRKALPTARRYRREQILVTSPNDTLELGFST